MAAARSVRLQISGRVQGVGYRDFACRAAAVEGVAGWVRNLRDGSVEAHVQGAREACDAFVERCRRGPPAGDVERIEVVRAPRDAALVDFEMRRTR
jgi:acylphosphatase